MSKLVLNREQINDIVFVDGGNKYSKGKRQEANKTYSRYQYFPDEFSKPAVFTVEDSNPFVKLIGTGNLESVTLNTTKATRVVKTVDDAGKETEETQEFDALEFVTCRTSDSVNQEEKILFEREERRMIHKAKLRALEASIESTEISAETINAILTQRI